ncbi:hypothetical protein ABTN20_20765, partial [Acinetobacter baumannii]
ATAAATAAAQSALDAAAAAQAASGGGIKISPTDTTPELLDAAITVSGALTKTLVNPGGNEHIDLSVDLSGLATTTGAT